MCSGPILSDIIATTLMYQYTEEKAKSRFYRKTVQRFNDTYYYLTFLIVKIMA